jgi:two-component system NtrC family sensor kinase
METNLSNRLQAMLLAVFTAGLVLLAVWNFRQEGTYLQPDDGVWWSEASNGSGLIAQRVLPDSPGERAGLKAGDLLTAVSNVPVTHIEDSDHFDFDQFSARPSSKDLAPANPVTHLSDLEQAFDRVGPFGNLHYSITRDGYRLETTPLVIPEPADRSLQQAERVIGLVYLAIGLYVLFRRWTAPRAMHFYLFCLVSFALYALKYTGKLDALDWTVLWCNHAAEALQPALFLHFALSFPEERLRHSGRRWILPLLYAPGTAVLALWIWAITRWQATGLLSHRLDQVSTAYIGLFYLLAATQFLWSYSKAGTPVLRQQLKWLTRGTLLAVLPFTLLYAIPFLLDLRVPALVTRLAGLSLIFLPLTFSWAIVRYRLMDTDLIFKRGVAYTLATGVSLGAYFGVIALAAGLAHNQLPASVRDYGEGIAIVLVLALFEPLKRRIQGWVDRVFDRNRYDYRKALIEFGRGLNSETDLNALLNAIVEQLPRTLLVSRVAIFLRCGNGNQLCLAASHGLPQEANAAREPGRLALGFLNFDRNQHTHIFLENAQQALHLPENERRAAALLDLNYYLPCRVQDGTGDGTGSQTGATTRTIAVIGLGRTIGGDFLSSEDVELLESLASYIGIALQNASLYTRLEAKIVEFERLKEFNENIVESINVGILAIDLEDRIESWNAQMEAMYALSRGEALGRPLSEVFPAEFIETLDHFRNESGVHHLYKFRLTTRAQSFDQAQSSDQQVQRIVNVAIAPLLSRDFVSVGRIILVDDITERVSLEAQLTQADKLSSIGLLAAGVAHEINTPLAVISSYAQMLAKQLKGDQRLSPVLEKITQQSFRAAEIANGLLNFSRTSTTEMRATNLNSVIRDTLSLLEHQFKTAQIDVELDLASELPEIQGNAGKLQQVFLNLLLNARDAMPGGGRLRVATLVNGHVEAVVSDSGSGISPDHLKRIYDPFFTTKTIPKADGKRGTGLGLSVSYGIMQEHAGKIHVESAVGSGTTFHLEFPLLRKSVHA